MEQWQILGYPNLESYQLDNGIPTASGAVDPGFAQAIINTGSPFGDADPNYLANQQAETETARKTAAEQAYYDSQIGGLNRLLGSVDTQNTGAKNILNNQKGTLMTGFGKQRVGNTQGKEKGLFSVDNFARNSLNSLQRLLRGAGAGGSSAYNSLVPNIVASGAGNRRNNVVNTAAGNEQSIDQAINDTESEFTNKASQYDLNAELKKNELAGQIADLQSKKALANGDGYDAVMAASAGTESDMANRQNQINALFGAFTPTVKAPELATYSVDPGQIASQGQGTPNESSYYLGQYKKKNKNNGMV